MAVTMIDRDIILARAREKYIRTGVTKSITLALTWYLERDAGPDEQIPLFVTTPELHQLRTVMTSIRPRCDECDTELNMQMNARDPNGKVHPTAWICKKCNVIYFSELTPAEWLKEIQDEARKQNLRKPDEPFPGDMPAGRKAAPI